MPEAELTPSGPPDESAAAEVLERGEVSIIGRMPWSSNATFLVEACHDGRTARGIYKPHAGERPLWDFPDGLYRREVAAYALERGAGLVGRPAHHRA